MATRPAVAAALSRRTARTFRPVDPLRATAVVVVAAKEQCSTGHDRGCGPAGNEDRKGTHLVHSRDEPSGGPSRDQEAEDEQTASVEGRGEAWPSGNPPGKASTEEIGYRLGTVDDEGFPDLISRFVSVFHRDSDNALRRRTSQRPAALGCSKGGWARTAYVHYPGHH